MNNHLVSGMICTVATLFVLSSLFFPDVTYAATLPALVEAGSLQATDENSLGQEEDQEEGQSDTTSTNAPSPTSTLTETATLTGTQPITNNNIPTGTLGLSIDTRLVNDVTSNDIFDPGDTIRYEISYQNKSNSVATAVALRGDYDERNAKIASAGSISSGGREAGGEIIWELGDIAAGAEGTQSFELTLSPAFNAGTTNVQLIATIESETTSANESGSFAVTAAPNLLVSVEGPPQLVLDQDVSGEINPGDTVQIMVNYRNNGTASATDLELKSTYAGSGDFISEITDVSDNGVIDGLTLTWEIAEIEAGGNGTFSYKVLLNNAFPELTNKVETKVALLGADGEVLVEDEGLFEVEAKLSLTVVPRSELVTDQNSNGQPDPEDTMKFTIEYKNDGSVNASNVVLKDKYGSRIQSISDISNDGTEDDQIVVWDLGEVAVGATGVREYEAILASDFSTGTTKVANISSLGMDNTDITSAEHSLTVKVAPSPTATPEPVQTERAVAGDTFSDSPWVPIVFIAFLALTTMGVITYLASSQERQLANVREPVYLVFIISSILVLTLADDLESDGAISILSAIVGYVFGRVSSPS